MRLEFDEDTEAIFGPNGIVGANGGKKIRRAPSRRNADLGVESLKALVARVRGVIHWVVVARNW